MSTTQPTFTDIVTIPTQQQIMDQEVLPQFSGGGLNITSWILNGPYRTIAMAIAFMRLSARTALAAILCCGFEDYVFGRATAPGGIDVTSYAGLVAKQRYGLIQKPATFTRRTITLTNASTSTYSNIQPGIKMILRFPSGNRWLLDQVVTLPAAVAGVPSVTQATFRSEFALTSTSTYQQDPSGAAISFVTSNFPGVTATNPAPVYSPVAVAGGGVGLVTPTGTPNNPHNITVKITSTGNASDNTVGWSTSLDGAAFVPQSGSTVTIDGIIITLSDNSGLPAFALGTVYYFSAPGTDITQNGAAQETPQALGQRVLGLWPLLGFQTDANGNFVPPASPTEAAYIALALSANTNVVIAWATRDPTINGLVRLYLAGQGGSTLIPTVIASEQQFFNSLNMLTDTVAVFTSAQRAVTLAMTGGAIIVKSSQVTVVKQTMQARLAAYFGGVDPLAPLSVNGLIDYDYVLSLIRLTPGVLQITGTLTINGGTTNIQLPVTPGAFENAYWQQQVATSLPFSGQ